MGSESNIAYLPPDVETLHLLPRLDATDWHNLRLVNRHFATLYRQKATNMTVGMCDQALNTLADSGTTAVRPSHSCPTVRPS